MYLCNVYNCVYMLKVLGRSLPTTAYTTLKAMAHKQDVVEAESEEAKHQSGGAMDCDWPME